MLQPGLVSITFRQLSPHEIIELAARTQLRGIEWGGDVHVPHGDTATAREVRRATTESGLEIAAYGSYYRVGTSEDEGLSFTHVLHTAIELEAPAIRVWAGTQNSEDAGDEHFNFIADELRHLSEKAVRAGIRVVTEFHGGTLCNTAASTRRLLETVNHPNLQTLWQPPVGLSNPDALQSLREVLPSLSYFHVFQWHDHERDALEEGEEAWREYFSIAKNQAQWALLEFVRDDDPEQFLRDAATLKRWCQSF